MKQMVPLEKQSKKQQKAFYAAQRGSWNGVVPVSRTVPSKKHYNRKRAKHWRDEDALPVLHSSPRRVILPAGTVIYLSLRQLFRPRLITPAWWPPRRSHANLYTAPSHRCHADLCMASASEAR